MLIIGEISSGILVACAPTLGPIFFPNRFGPKAKARHQHPSSRRLFRKGSSNGLPYPRPVLSGLHESPYITLAEDDVELKAALGSGNVGQVYAGGTSTPQGSCRHPEPNTPSVHKHL